MTNRNTLKRNIFFNVGGYVVSVVAAFLIAPITISSLGDTRYGCWTLVSELIGYYGLLDLGIRGAVTYYVAMFVGRNQENNIKEIISSAFWILLICGLLAFFVGISITIGFSYLFKLGATHLVEVQQSLLIMSGLVALSLPMNAFAGALVGRQRFDITSGIEIANRILTTFLVYLALKAGGGLVALALVQALGRVMSWACTLMACRKVLGGVFARPKWFRRGRVRELAGYGLRNAVGQIAQLVIYRIDLTVVGMVVGVDKVTFYAIAGMLVSYASSLCTNITFVFMPKFTQLNLSDNIENLQAFYFFSLRTVGMVITGLVAGMLVFGHDFIRLWLGEIYVIGAWTDRSDVIMAILIIANLPQLLQSLTRQRLYGEGRVRFLMWLSVCEAIANLSLSLLLVRPYGPAGVALGTLLPVIISQVLVMPVYSCRVFNVPLIHFLRKGFTTPLLAGALMFAMNLALVRIIPPATLNYLFIDVFCAIILGALLCAGIGFSPTEREDIWQQLVHLFKK